MVKSLTLSLWSILPQHLGLGWWCCLLRPAVVVRIGVVLRVGNVLRVVGVLRLGVGLPVLLAWILLTVLACPLEPCWYLRARNPEEHALSLAVGFMDEARAPDTLDDLVGEVTVTRACEWACLEQRASSEDDVRVEASDQLLGSVATDKMLKVIYVFEVEWRLGRGSGGSGDALDWRACGGCQGLRAGWLIFGVDGT